MKIFADWQNSNGIVGAVAIPHESGLRERVRYGNRTYIYTDVNFLMRKSLHDSLLVEKG